MCVPLPKRQILYRILTNFETHSLYNTLKGQGGTMRILSAAMLAVALLPAHAARCRR